MISLREHRARLSKWASVEGVDRVVPRVYLLMLRPDGARIAEGRVHGLYRRIDSPAPVEANDILRRFIGMAWRRNDVAPFVRRFGALDVTEEGWPSGWISYRQATFAPRSRKDDQFEDIPGERVDWYRHYASLIAAVLAIAGHVRDRLDGRPQTSAIATLRSHWERVATVHRDDWPAAVAGWTQMASHRMAVLERLETASDANAPAQLFHEVMIFAHWWLEAGGCSPTLSWSAYPSAPAVAWRGGAWGGVGLALLRALENSKGTAICDHCQRPVLERQRKGKVGQKVWCSSAACQRFRSRESVRASRARRKR